MSDPYRTAADRGESPENPFQCEEKLATVSSEQVHISLVVEVQRPAGKSGPFRVTVRVDTGLGAGGVVASAEGVNPDLARRRALGTALRIIAEEIQTGHAMPSHARTSYP